MTIRALIYDWKSAISRKKPQVWVVFFKEKCRIKILNFYLDGHNFTLQKIYSKDAHNF